MDTASFRKARIHLKTHIPLTHECLFSPFVAENTGWRGDTWRIVAWYGASIGVVHAPRRCMVYWSCFVKSLSLSNKKI